MKMFLVIPVWFIIGILVCWNGAGAILNTTSIEFLQDNAIRMIVQIVAVFVGTGLVTSLGSIATLGFFAIFER